MFCSKCGTENKDNAKFCSKCGAQLPNRKKPLLIAVICMLAVIACVIGIVAYLNSQKEAEYNKKQIEAVEKESAGDAPKKDSEEQAAEDEGSESAAGITKAELTDGYWENNIQAPYLYRFYEDGTVESYGLEPYDYLAIKESGEEVKEEYLYYSQEGNYSLKDGQLTIQWEQGFQTVLEQVTKDDPIDWDPGLSEQLAEIPDGTLFFYETGWGGEIATNAIYLVKLE